MLNAATLDAIEQALEGLPNDGSEEATQLADELGKRPQAAVFEQQQIDSESAQLKMKALLESHSWMMPEQIRQVLSRIARENASAKSKRRKMIAIANHVTTALEPYMACGPGCSACCHMNTMIYEHEAIRLAEVTGRKMVRLAYRPLDQIALEGYKFNGKPCPFLVENKCSVYDDRPLVCRTHHSLRDDAAQCSMNLADNYVPPPMYDPDILEVPYMELNASYNPVEPWGNIAEFFPT